MEKVLIPQEDVEPGIRTIQGNVQEILLKAVTDELIKKRHYRYN